jgi:hypothetical protein
MTPWPNKLLQAFSTSRSAAVPELWTLGSVIGGLTGSHSGGHGEQGWQKLKLVLSSGYIPIQGEADWSPPPLSERDARRVLHIQTTGEIGYI